MDKNLPNSNSEELPVPTPDRPMMPQDYGIPESASGTLPWSFVDEQMEAARNYWVTTVRPDGRPHAMPVWGAWVNGKLYVEAAQKRAGIATSPPTPG